MEAILDEMQSMDSLLGAFMLCNNKDLQLVRGVAKNEPQTISASLLRACIEDCKSAAPLFRILKDHAADMGRELVDRAALHGTDTAILLEKHRDQLREIEEKLFSCIRSVLSELKHPYHYDGDINDVCELAQAMIPLKEACKDAMDALVLALDEASMSSLQLLGNEKDEGGMHFPAQLESLLHFMMNERQVVVSWNIHFPQQNTRGFFTPLAELMDYLFEKKQWVLTVEVDRASMQRGLQSLGYNVSTFSGTGETLSSFYMQKYLAKDAVDPNSKPVYYNLDLVRGNLVPDATFNGRYIILQCMNPHKEDRRYCLLGHKYNATKGSMTMTFIPLRQNFALACQICRKILSMK